MVVHEECRCLVTLWATQPLQREALHTNPPADTSARPTKNSYAKSVVVLGLICLALLVVKWAPSAGADSGEEGFLDYTSHHGGTVTPFTRGFLLAGGDAACGDIAKGGPGKPTESYLATGEGPVRHKVQESGHGRTLTDPREGGDTTFKPARLHASRPDSGRGSAGHELFGPASSNTAYALGWATVVNRDS